MTAAYLWFNAALYAVFAVLCTVRWPGTSSALGYMQLNPSGRSEYLAVYGGLQMGLAVFFALAALKPELHRAGIWLATALYVPIVAFRWIAVATQGPVEKLTLGVGGLEAVLALTALALLLHDRLQGQP